MREAYATLRRTLAAQYGHDRPAYTQGKSDFIRAVFESTASGALNRVPPDTTSL